MTTATDHRGDARRAAAHQAQTGTESSLTGTRTLIRLNLRLDRFRILIWTLALGLGVWASVYSLYAAYPTDEALQSRAALMGNPATIMMTGPAFGLDDYTFGAMVANELALYVLLAAAIMSILLAVRHTRAEEESGRLELVRSMPVGRNAPALSAVVAVAVANVLVGAATAAALLLLTGMQTASSLAFGAATAVTGMVFAALATVAAQVTEHASAATGMTMAVLAVAFLVRGVGDVIDNQGSWLSWLSPFAWAQQTRFFVDLRWWPLGVSLAAVVLLFALAVVLARRRDVGAGLRQPRKGPATAARTLLSPAGLAARLLRGSLAAWAISVLFFATAMGSLANSLDGMLADNPALADWIAIEGTDLTGEFASVMLSFVMIAPAILAVSGVLRLKSEEESGRTEQLIVSGSSRVGYLAGWASTVAMHAVILTVVGGFGVGLGVSAGTGEWRWVGEMVVAAVVYLPAILLTAAAAVALYGLLPRSTVIAWLLVVWVAVILFLGELLEMPDWAINVSPFTHTPVLPGEEAQAAPLLIMGGIAAALTGIGLVGFRRRDITSR